MVLDAACRFAVDLLPILTVVTYRSVLPSTPEHVPDQPQAQDQGDDEAAVAQRQRSDARADDHRRADDQAGDDDPGRQGVAGPRELADQALEVLEVEPDLQLSALDRLQ